LQPRDRRFISEDPIGWASGQTNAYAYVGGNPVQFTDPLGFGKAGFGQMGNNGRENKQARDVAVALGLNKDQRQKLHDAITGQGYDYHEIKNLAIEMFCPDRN
jgi:uncharacterized protein RhaS with RHS repeats